MVAIGLNLFIACLLGYLGDISDCLILGSINILFLMRIPDYNETNERNENQ